MASGTDTKTAAPAPQAATTTAGPPAHPTLMVDLDPVLLLRLFPGKIDIAGARTAALAQGEATATAGAANLAAQQQPVAR